MSFTDRTRSTELVTHLPAAGVGCRFVVIDGRDRGMSCDLATGELLIGKSSSCGMTLTDPAVSARHVIASVVPEGISIVDQDSKNGVVHLGARVARVVVVPGDVITLGTTRLAITSRERQGVDYSARRNYGALLGGSAAMRQLFAVLERIEDIDHTVLITGETGVGKELVAREIHAHSKRRDKPMLVFDCGAVSRELAEAELFGHARGAFTGAVRSRDGVFLEANGGTVFLDEIGELPLELQPKLLRVLAEKEIRQVGSERVRRLDVRVVAATNRDLAAEVAAGRFREDLFFRLDVVQVRVPPLRERREDIPELVRRFATQVGVDELGVSASTLDLFASSYAWPGNVRELRNAIARVAAVGSLPESLKTAAESATRRREVSDEPFDAAKKKLLDAFERDYFAGQLARHDNNLAQAARASGIDRAYFKRLLRRHGLLPNG